MATYTSYNGRTVFRHNRTQQNEKKTKQNKTKGFLSLPLYICLGRTVSTTPYRNILIYILYIMYLNRIKCSSPFVCTAQWLDIIIGLFLFLFFSTRLVDSWDYCCTSAFQTDKKKTLVHFSFLPFFVSHAYSQNGQQIYEAAGQHLYSIHILLLYYYFRIYKKKKKNRLLLLPINSRIMCVCHVFLCV